MLAKILKGLAITLFGALLGASAADATSLALTNVPLVQGLTQSVPPNIFVILDNSASMQSDYIPDGASGYTGSLCYYNPGFNKLAYNPNVTYTPPPLPAGGTWANQTFTAAHSNIYGDPALSGTTSSTTDLSATTATPTTLSVASNGLTTTKSSTTVTVTLAAAAPSTLTTGTVVTISGASASVGGISTTNLNKSNVTITVLSSTTFSYTAGASATSAASGGGSSVKVAYNVNIPNYYYAVYNANPLSPPTTTTCPADTSYTKTYPTTAADQQNFANWYTYYRYRINMMKSTLSRAFVNVNPAFRVGFTTIQNNVTTPSTNSNAPFMEAAPFSAANLKTFLTLVQGTDSSGGSGTRLRGELALVGRYYAGYQSNQSTTATRLTAAHDPVQYACQQNFALLTTDGYWTSNDDSSTGFGAIQLNPASQIGNVDGTASTLGTPAPPVPPYLDKNNASNTLADVAYYYYWTDLRPTSGTSSLNLGGLLPDGVTQLDVTPNIVPVTASDPNPAQHMTTFTLGLGAPGTLDATNYTSGGSAAYKQILAGTLAWPTPTDNSSGDSTDIDDLWHAAVNGHGVYLSAGDPTAVLTALNLQLAAISKTVGSAAAVATSNLQPVAGDNAAYSGQYSTAVWTGDLNSYSIDLSTGAISGTSNWASSAATQLTAAVSASSDTRTIWTWDTANAGGNHLKAFQAANLATEIAAGDFQSWATTPANPNGALSQSTAWTSTLTTAATQAAMIGYIRGQTQYNERSGNTYQLFRDRTTPLGDIVDSAPTYVKKPPFSYLDSGYSTFAANNAGRLGTVYVGANDGMLHAFDSATGAERWAYIPSMLVPYLYKLADDTYPNNHRFYVDGPITVGDAYNSGTSTWSTILIGGLADGGQGYYALDVTDPSNPVALWEISSKTTGFTNLGNTYGNPILTKRASDGKWVAIFASGYNTANGNGYVYVVDAFSGALLTTLSASTAADSSQSGIAKLTNYVASTLTNNSTEYVYGGDLAGNLWRFDITGAAPVSLKMGQTSATVGAQPITVKPEIGLVKDSNGTSWRVIYFGTGRYLTQSDITANTTAQAIYAVKDTGALIGTTGVFTATTSNLVQQVLDTSVTPRTIDSPAAVDLATKNGWYLTLPVGELVDVDPKLQLGTLTLISNSPATSTACVIGGSSWLYSLNYATGAPISGQKNAVGAFIDNSLSTGLTVVKLPNGKLVAIVTEASTTLKNVSVPTASSSAATIRRVSWREIN